MSRLLAPTSTVEGREPVTVKDIHVETSCYQEFHHLDAPLESRAMWRRVACGDEKKLRGKASGEVESECAQMNIVAEIYHLSQRFPGRRHYLARARRS